MTPPISYPHQHNKMNEEYIQKLKKLANETGMAFTKSTFMDTHEGAVFRQQFAYLLGYIEALPESPSATV